MSWKKHSRPRDHDWIFRLRSHWFLWENWSVGIFCRPGELPQVKILLFPFAMWQAIKQILILWFYANPNHCEGFKFLQVLALWGRKAHPLHLSYRQDFFSLLSFREQNSHINYIVIFNHFLKATSTMRQLIFAKPTFTSTAATGSYAMTVTKIASLRLFLSFFHEI